MACVHAGGDRAAKRVATDSARQAAATMVASLGLVPAGPSAGVAAAAASQIPLTKAQVGGGGAPAPSPVVQARTAHECYGHALCCGARADRHGAPGD